MKSSEAFGLAERKSRYGHRTWIVWKNRDGTWGAGKKCRESLKAALLANGTQGQRWFVVNGRQSMVGFWWLGLNMIRQLKYASDGLDR